MYSWMIIYTDETTEITKSDDVYGAIVCAKDIYCKSVYAVVRMNFD